jgi:integrating conjugative element protein (TIGR03757 family)
MNQHITYHRKSAWLIGWLCLLLSGLSQTAQAEPLLVEVFTDALQGPPPSDVGPGRSEITTTVYDLSAPQQAAQALANELRLPADPASAMTEAKTYLQRHGLELASKVGQAQISHQKALAYGLTRYPALVINQEAIVYGSTDVQEAVRQYRSWQAAKGKP